MPMIKKIIFFIFFHDSISRSWPAIICVVSPMRAKRAIKKSIMVIKLIPPICTRASRTIWPNRVKLLNGTVKSPVTQVTEVEVKKRSRSGMSTLRDIGRERRIVPTVIVTKSPSKILLPGEKRDSFLVLPIMFVPFL